MNRKWIIIIGVLVLVLVLGLLVVTATPTPTPVPATPTPTAMPVITPTAVPPASAPSCLHGEVVWSNSTNNDMSPVGGLEETRWIVGEAWHMLGGNIKSYVFLIPPQTVAWLQHNLGGTAWGVCADEDGALAIARQHVANLLARDGIEPTLIILPRDADSFPLLDHLQTD